MSTYDRVVQGAELGGRGKESSIYRETLAFFALPTYGWGGAGVGERGNEKCLTARTIPNYRMVGLKVFKGVSFYRQK
jgi:hypothetical protein